MAVEAENILKNSAEQQGASEPVGTQPSGPILNGVTLPCLFIPLQSLFIPLQAVGGKAHCRWWQNGGVEQLAQGAQKPEPPLGDKIP